MALAQRVSVMEEYEPSWSREPSPARQPGRKLSYNPIGEWVGEATEAGEQPIGAFEVSKTKRIIQVIVAVIYCLFGAGVVFGFAAIKPVLIKEGVYNELCTKEEIENGAKFCYEQELKLNLMFTIAAVSTNVCALPVGTLLDRYGPRVSGIIGSIFLALGSVLFAFARELPFDGYIPGYLLLALGGPFIFISSFQLSNTFPQNSGLILALLTGAFDTSSAVFLVYRLLYQGTNESFGIKKFFLLYLIVPAFILVAQLIVMPPLSYKTVGELVAHADDPRDDIHDSDDEIEDEGRVRDLREARRVHRESIVSEVTSLLGTKNAVDQTVKEEEKRNVSGVWGALHGQSALQQIKSPWWILIALFTVVQMLRINYFVATIRTQYTHLLHSFPKAVQINNFFDVALPLGGVISVPFIGLILDNTSTVVCLSLLVAIATTIGILGIIPEMWAAYTNVVLFVLYRPLYYTTVSDYSAKVFGFGTFGKVYGLIICFAGLLNFSQSGLDTLNHVVFHDDPKPINAILLGTAFVIGTVLVGFVFKKSRKYERVALEERAMSAEERERLMPDAEISVMDYGAASQRQNGQNDEEARGRSK